MFRQVVRHVRNFALFALAAASLLGAGTAQAAFPERPITLIVPFNAGGPSDAVARIVGEHMSRALGQQIVIYPESLRIRKIACSAEDLGFVLGA